MKLSIIVPVYNTESYLPHCLESIASQGFGDFEVLLIDDGSSDGSAAICDAYSAADPRFKVVHTPNGGVSKARNIALQMAAGEWILFIDSDDTIAPDTLSIVDEGEGCDFIQFGYNKVRNGEITYRSPLPTESLTLSGEEYCRARYYHSGICGYFIRRSILEEHNILFPTHIRYGEDQAFILNLLLHVRACRVVSRHGYNYLDNPSSAMNSAWSRGRIDNFLHTIEEVATYAHKQGITLPPLHRYMLHRFAKSYMWQTTKLTRTSEDIRVTRARYRECLERLKANDYGLRRYDSILLIIALLTIYKTRLKR